MSTLNTSIEKTKFCNSMKRFQPKNLAYTELGFHLREKLGNCDWQTDSFHTYPHVRTSIDFANRRMSLRALAERTGVIGF